jgi:hypothetical protein
VADSHLASLTETLAAQAFLKTVGADWTNTSLVIAVVAWYRVSLHYYSPKGGLKDVGYNPFFLKPGSFDKGIRIGTFKSKNKLHEGTFSVYKTLADSLRALANYLLAGRHTDSKFRLLVNAFRSGRVADALSGILQTSLAVGKYDAHSVTMRVGPAHHAHDEDVWVPSPLYAAYNAITGSTVPGKPKAPPKPPPKPPKPHGEFVVPPPFSGYVSPFHAGTFYRARKHDTVSERQVP